MKHLVLLLFILLSTGLYSQIYNSDTLTTIAYWEKGETYKYQLDKYRYKQKNEDITETNSTSYITFHIQEQTDSNYLIKYTTDSIKIKGVFENNPLINAVTTEISNKLIYLIETDENGNLIEIKNWEELKENIVQLYSQMEMFDTMDEKQKEQANQAIETMTDSKEKIQSMFTREFIVLFTNYGYVFDTKDTIEYNQLLPNPYGGNPFPQTGKIYFDTISRDSINSITLYDKSSIDEEEGKKAIVHMLKQLSPKNEGIEKEMKNVEFKVNDSMVQEFSLINGSIVNAVMERQVVSNDLKNKSVRIDRQTWKLLNVE